MVQLHEIHTEQRNAQTQHIDRLATFEMLRLINEEDKKVAYAVQEVLPEIAKAVDCIYEKMCQGGRLIYCGCGTSGRLGVLDAAECPPTFGTDPSLVVALIAGGLGAVVKAVEGAEDNVYLGAEDLQKIEFSKEDVLVGIAASGRTPYVIGAMTYAQSIGAKVIAITCCPGSEIDVLSDIGIAPNPGPEVITGSTRLKSGTAQKMVLNMISTAVMIKLGKVYGNLMVDVKATNEKLVARTVSIVKSVTGVEDEIARKVLSQCDYEAKKAIVMILCGLDAEGAQQALEVYGGRIADVVNSKQVFDNLGTGDEKWF